MCICIHKHNKHNVIVNLRRPPPARATVWLWAAPDIEIYRDIMYVYIYIYRERERDWKRC